MLVEIFIAFMEKFGRRVKVVILIDEYDSPVRSALSDPRRAEENRSVLLSFYGKIKSLSDQGMIRLFLVAGETKFAGGSIFSSFNQCHDLTPDEEYAAVCGFTRREFEDHMSGFLPEILEHGKSEGFLPPGTTAAEFRRLVYDH
jgi:hypothetical protein